MNDNLTEKKTDSYIKQLVEQIEKNELIKAPPNMKYEILQKARRKNHSINSYRKNKMEFIYYSIKVTTAAAISLVILFSADYIAPNKIENNRWQKVIVNQLNEKTTQITSSLTSISNQILKMEVLKNEKKKK